MEHTIYRVRWNPDSRFLSGHWSVSSAYTLSMDEEPYMRGNRGHYTFLSDAVKHPLKMSKEYPERVHVNLPDDAVREEARRYYGQILNHMFNETEGKYIGC